MDKVKLQSVEIFDAKDVLISKLSHDLDVFSRLSSPTDLAFTNRAHASS